MRILQISHGIYPASQAGTEIYTANLAEALCNIGVDATVAVPENETLRQLARSSALPPYVCPIQMAPEGRFGNKLRYLTLRGPIWKDRLIELVSRTKPDLVHVHHLLRFGLSALDLLERLNLPLVMTLPDYWLLCPGILRRCGGDASRCAHECCANIRAARVFGSKYVNKRRERVLRFVKRARPTLAAISDSTRETFERSGFPKDLLLTHKWGIPTANLRGMHKTLRDSEHSRSIGYLGSLRPHKGCHVLLDSFSRLTSNASLHFFGSGDQSYVNELRRRALGLNVHFHGAFDHSRIGNILEGIDVVVVPSIWEETYCLVAQEAMAARIPLIASRVGGLADRIDNGKSGFLVRPNDPEDLTRQLKSVLSTPSAALALLNYDDCLLSIEEDAQSWVTIYASTIARWSGRR